VERKLVRERIGALTICRGTNQSDEDADRIIDVSRPGMREPEGWRFETTRRTAAQPTMATAMQMRWESPAIALSLTVAERTQQ
jgi:hypothetical protein